MATMNQRRVLKASNLTREYPLHILVGGLAFAAVLFGSTYLKLTEINQLVDSISDRQLAAELSQRILLVSATIFVSTVGFIASVSVYVLILAQRVGGPVIAITRYVREIREGKYDAKRVLRENDELGPIMDELRELAKELAQARKP